MKKLHYIGIFSALLVLISCKDELESPVGNTYLKSIDLGEDFYTLSAFGLDDGSTIMTLWGMETSDLVKIDSNGKLIWRSDIFGNVWFTWAGVSLSNGNTLVFGFDGYNNNTQAGAVIFSPEGELLHTVTFQNQVGTTTLEVLYSLDGIELSTGEIALVMPVITSATSPTLVRLMRFDQKLQLINSRIYSPDSIVQNVRTRQISIDEDREGNLLVQGRALPMINVPSSPNTFVMKLEKENYNPVYFETFGDNTTTIPSRVAAGSDGAAVWASAGPTLTSAALISRFSLFGEKTFSIGTEINVWKSDGPHSEIQKIAITGFPKFGFVQKVRSCSDGGFILTGTCNFNSNQEIPSDYRILLVKLDRDLNVEWMRVPDTYSAALGADAVEIPGGFLVSGSHYSFHEYNNPFVFKIDFQGNIY